MSWNNQNQKYLSKQEKQDLFREFAGIQEAKELLNKKWAWINTADKPIRDKETNKIVLPHSVYLGDKVASNGQVVPSWEHHVMDYTKLADSLAVINNASASATEIDKARVSPFSKEFQRFVDLLNAPGVGIQAAEADSMITSQDFPGINIISYAGALVATQPKAYPLINAFSTEFTTEMVFPEVYADDFEIDYEIGEGQKPKPKKPQFHKTTFTMHKSGVELQWTDEALRQAYIIDPFAESRRMINEGVRKVYEKKILALLGSASITDISGELYTGYTNGRSTYNPITKIQEAELAIYTADGRANLVVMSPKSWFLFLSNDNIRGQFNVQGLPGTDGAFSSAATPGYRYIIDPEYENTKLIIMDDSILKRKQGPIIVGTIRDDESLTNKYVYFNFNTAYINNVAKARRITGITS